MLSRQTHSCTCVCVFVYVHAVTCFYGFDLNLCYYLPFVQRSPPKLENKLFLWEVLSFPVFCYPEKLCCKRMFHFCALFCIKMYLSEKQNKKNLNHFLFSRKAELDCLHFVWMRFVSSFSSTTRATSCLARARVQRRALCCRLVALGH